MSTEEPQLKQKRRRAKAVAPAAVAVEPEPTARLQRAAWLWLRASAPSADDAGDPPVSGAVGLPEAEPGVGASQTTPPPNNPRGALPPAPQPRGRRGHRLG